MNSAQISLDNGTHFIAACDLTGDQVAVVIADLEAGNGDGDIREQTHLELAPCADRTFIERYLELYAAEHGCAPVLG